MTVLQHNWTGYLAIHASFTSPALCLAQPVKGVNTGKSSSRGAWIKANKHARLRLHASNELQPCKLSLHVQDHVLLERELNDGQLRLAVLPCQETSVLLMAPQQQVSNVLACGLPVARNKSVLAYQLLQLESPVGSGPRAAVPQQLFLPAHSMIVLGAGQRVPPWHDAAHALQELSTAAPITFCISFFDQPDCDSFTTALQTMLTRQQQAIQQAQQAAEQQAAVQQPQNQRVAADAATASASAAAKHARAEGSRPIFDGSSAAAAMELQEEARAAIKVCFGKGEYEAPSLWVSCAAV